MYKRAPFSDPGRNSLNHPGSRARSDRQAAPPGNPGKSAAAVGLDVGRIDLDGTSRAASGSRKRWLSRGEIRKTIPNKARIAATFAHRMPFLVTPEHAGARSRASRGGTYPKPSTALCEPLCRKKQTSGFGDAVMRCF